MLAGYHPEQYDPESYLFNIMDKVNQEGRTQVSIVYQPSATRLAFKTAHNLNKRIIDVNHFDFSPSKPHCALFWHNDNIEDNWNPNLDWVNSYMLDHFSDNLWLDTFKPYKGDLKKYPVCK